jgi:hypothetical protein
VSPGISALVAFDLPLQDKPTGFEEYYVDAPITVEEHKLEQDLYHV